MKIETDAAYSGGIADSSEMPALKATVFSALLTELKYLCGVDC
jgi:hypothetical protein